MKKFMHGYMPLLLTFGCILFLNIKSKAQEEELEDIAHHWEVGVTTGANAFFGDLGGNKGRGETFIKDYNTKTTKPLVGVFADYFRYSWLALKGTLNYTNVDGADSLIKNTGDLERWRYYRNLSFRSRILEGSLNAEIYPVMIFDKDYEIHKISPYFSLGLGLFHYNPQTMYDDQWVYLHPLRTEGEGFSGMNTYTNPATGVTTTVPFPKQYHLLGVYIPVTLGVKVYFDNTYALSVGVTFRHTFTDYIDDVNMNYIDPSLFDKYLSASQAVLAKQLYERSLTPWKVKPTINRGNDDAGRTDTYTNIFLTFSIRFGNGPKFYYGG